MMKAWACSIWSGLNLSLLQFGYKLYAKWFSLGFCVIGGFLLQVSEARCHTHQQSWFFSDCTWSDCRWSDCRWCAMGDTLLLRFWASFWSPMWFIILQMYFSFSSSSSVFFMKVFLHYSWLFQLDGTNYLRFQGALKFVFLMKGRCVTVVEQPGQWFAVGSNYHKVASVDEMSFDIQQDHYRPPLAHNASFTFSFHCK